MLIQVIKVVHFSHFFHVQFCQVQLTWHAPESQRTEMCISGQALENLRFLLEQPMANKNITYSCDNMHVYVLIYALSISGYK